MNRTPIPQQIRKAVFATKGHTCNYCRRDLLTLPPEDRTLDHIEHVRWGGRHTVSNLVPCCRRCNSMRHMMDEKEFAVYLVRRAEPGYRWERRKAAIAYYKHLKAERAEAAKKGWRRRRATKAR